MIVVVGGDLAADLAGVPAGPLPRLVHRNAAIPPLNARAPRWMWNDFMAPASLRLGLSGGCYAGVRPLVRSHTRRRATKAAMKMPSSAIGTTTAGTPASALRIATATAGNAARTSVCER